MTIQRFLYKVFWKKVGVPLIICCGFIALATTFYHHSRFGVIEAPQETGGDAAHFHRMRKKASEHEQLVRGMNKEQGLSLLKEKDNVLRYKGNEENRELDGAEARNQKQSPLNGTVQTQLKVQKNTDTNQNELDNGISKETVDSKSEIELDDAFFDDLRKPHIHVEGGIVAVESNSHSFQEDYQYEADTNYLDTLLQKRRRESEMKMNYVTDVVKSTDFNKTYYREQLEKAMADYHMRGSDIGKQNQTDLILKEKQVSFKNTFNKSDNMEHTGENLNVFEKYKLSRRKKNKENSVNEVLKYDIVEKEREDSIQGVVIDRVENESDVYSEAAEPEYDSVVGIGKEDYVDSFLPPDMPIGAKLTPMRNPGLSYSSLNTPTLFTRWAGNPYTACKDKFQGYGNEFAYLKNVIVDKSKFIGRAGGEEIEEVLNQDEKKEYYEYDMGCFQLKCDERPQYYFNNGHHVNEFMFNLKTSDVKSKDFDEEIEEFTIVVTRYEYVNLYHTMTDWYNAFLVMNFFNKTQAKTSVLLVDAHPKGGLDSVWGVVFKSVKRLSDLNSRTKFHEMAWSILGYNSLLLSHYEDEIPLTEEYREFFLGSYGINSKRTLHCDKLNILFIWRRNYVAHPRNPKGSISRKIRNERALLMAVKRHYRDHHVSGVQIDLFDMRQQLKLIAEADVLIGMHGAGLTHAMFLPKHAGLIEFVPSYWGAMDHFLAIAKWRDLMYERWVNMDPNIEIIDQSTRVPPPIVTSLLRSVLMKMKCLKPAGGFSET